MNPAKSIGSRDGLQGLSNGFLQCLGRSSIHAAQKGFELGEGFFNGRVIRRISQQEQQWAALRPDQLLHPCAFVDAQIAHHDNLPRFQAGARICSSLFSPDLFYTRFSSLPSSSILPPADVRYSVRTSNLAKLEMDI